MFTVLVFSGDYKDGAVIAEFTCEDFSEERWIDESNKHIINVTLEGVSDVNGLGFKERGTSV